MLSLINGHYPSSADEVAVTNGVASAFHLSIGKTWKVGGVNRDVVGIVQNRRACLMHSPSSCRDRSRTRRKSQHSLTYRLVQFDH